MEAIVPPLSSPPVRGPVPPVNGLQNGHVLTRPAGTEDFVAKRVYISQHLPDSQLSAFHAQVSEAAALACTTGELQPLRDLIENWEATAEIYALPSEAEKVLEAIGEAEATRDERRSQGEWDWQTEQQTFLQTRNKLDPVLKHRSTRRKPLRGYCIFSAGGTFSE